MRKTCILLILSILVVLGCIPYSAVQVIPAFSGRVAIVIVIDGADSRVLADVDTPNLDALALEGAWTNNSLTTLPSSSTTAHASLATGAYPEATCVVNTNAVNTTEYHEGTATEPEKTYNYLQLLNATTLIETANLYGVHTAVIVGEEELNVMLGKTQVAERYRVLDILSVTADYDEWIANETIMAIEDFNATVKRGEDLLMLVSMPATKWAGYDYGPNSEEYNKALENADLQVGRIVNRIKELKLWNNTLLFVTADHGMVTTNPDETVLKTEEHRWGEVLTGIYHWIIDAGGKAAHIYLKNLDETQKAVNYLWGSGVVDLIYSRVDVNDINGTLGKWLWRDIHLDVNYSGDLFVMLKSPYQYWQKNSGAQGSWDTQRVPLYMAGWNTKVNHILKGQPEIIDIAPTVAAFLEIPVPEKSQGKILMEAFFTPFAETSISASPAILFPGDITQFNVSFSIIDSTENMTLKNYILDEEGEVVEHIADYPVNKSSEVKNYNWTANETGTYMITSYLSMSINGEEYVISWTQSRLLVIEKVESPYPLMQVIAACIIGIVPSILMIWVSFKYKSRRQGTVEPKKKK